MSTDRIQKRLNVETSKTSVNTNVLLKINLDTSNIIMPTNNINHIVNLAEQFNKERQTCSFYRIIGTINPLVSNPLFNLSNSRMLDKYTWAGFNNFEFLDSSYPHDDDNYDDGDFLYPSAINKYLKENNGWFGYFDPDVTKTSLCNFFDMEPKRERFSLLPDINPYISDTDRRITTPVKNWELTITYPKLSDKTHPMIKDGLLIVDMLPATVSNKNMVAFGLPCFHNLVIGDSVRISGTTGYNGDFTIVRLGLDNGDLQDYYFVIDLPSTGAISANSRIKRLVNGYESEYYFRKFRKIKTKVSPVIETDDYETYEAAFSQNIFNDTIVQFVFNEDIDVSNLTDNLERPLSELYLTIVKTDSYGLFTKVSSGVETPFISNLNSSVKNQYLRALPVISKIHNGGDLPFPSHTPLESDVTIENNNNGPQNNDFYGDLVEFNPSDLNETILVKVSHRFNTNSRETKSLFTYNNVQGNSASTVTIDLGPRQEGYYYQPHHLIKIREFSNYIEEGDKNTFNLPKYAITLGDNRYLWRDLLDIGFNESDKKSLDYPFLNGAHYMYQNYNFSLKRQDHLGIWGLYYGTFPADPMGIRITDKFATNSQIQMFVNKFKINMALISTATTATTINIPIDMDYQLVDQSEIIETEFVDKEVDLAINPILDYEKVRYLPLDLQNKHIDKIVYDVKLLNGNFYTGFYGEIGFTDDDIQFRKNNFKETFLNLAFYDTPNPLTQKLIANMTLFSELNSGDFLPLSSTNGAPGRTKPANQIPINFVLENPILNPRGFSEGYHLYMYKDDLTVGLTKYIFMKASFKNAKTGKSINLMVKDKKLPIDKLINELYTRYRLVRYTDGYFYEIDNNYNGNGESTPNNVTYTNSTVTVALYQITST